MASNPNFLEDSQSDNLDHALDDVIESIEQMQAELNYQSAQAALSTLVNNLSLSPRERGDIETAMQGLQTMLDKLDRMVIQIAVFGMVGRGKSSLLNALLGQELFETGPTHGVTRQIQNADWVISEEAIAPDDSPLIRVALNSIGDSKIELIDTPGIDEVDGQRREQLAKQVAQQADLILFVIAGDITRIEYEALLTLRQASKPILIVLNKVDQYSQVDRDVIYQKLRDERLRSLISEDEIVMTAAAPLVRKAVRDAEGHLQVSMERGQPDVSTLKLKILELLQQDGKALVALNTLLYADNVNEQIVQRKLAIRDRAADDIIWSATLTEAIAIALNPVMVLDMVGGAVIDMTLIVALSKLYGLPMTQQGALGLLKKIMIGMGGVTATELLAAAGLSSLKGVMGATAPFTGGLSLAPYVPVALAQAGVAGLSTYGIGQVAKVYLANGATWGTEGPKAVIQQILSSLDEDSVLNRIRAELEAKIGRSTPPISTNPTMDIP